MACAASRSKRTPVVEVGRLSVYSGRLKLDLGGRLSSGSAEVEDAEALYGLAAELDPEAEAEPVAAASRAL